MNEEFELAQRLLGGKRLEEGADNIKTTTLVGTAISDSENGYVEVEYDGMVSYPDDVAPGEGRIVIPTGPKVHAGDSVMIDLYGGVGKTPTVANVPGWGDAVNDLAEQAEADAARAAIAAENAEESATQAAASAASASTSAQQAAADASTAAASAQQAVADAGTAAQAATDAASSASQAQSSASSAQTAATNAATSASQAQSSASTAATAAQNAETKATQATTAANSALAQLGTVEDVLGTVNWITEHGTYSKTTDTQVDDSKVYYTRTGSGTQQDPYIYTEVAEPTQAGLANYYELTIDQALSQFVASHLVLTNAGLYVLKDNNGYKVLLSNTGMTVYDPSGRAVATYGEGITFDSNRPITIGNNNAYIEYYDSNDDGIADSLRIKADSVSIGTTSVSSELNRLDGNISTVSGDLASYETTTNSTLQNLQNQVDGQIESYFESYEPTTSNLPASGWTTDAEKQRHEGDLFYKSDSGEAWRWMKTNNVWGWTPIPAGEAQEALAAAQAAQQTANKNVKSSIQLWYTKANTTAPSKPSGPDPITSASTSGNAWRIVVPAWNATYPNYFYCWQYKFADDTYGWSDVVRDIGMGETQQQARLGVTNAATAQGTANQAVSDAAAAQSTANTAVTNAATAQGTADQAVSDAAAAQATANKAVESKETLWYTKANTTAPSKPSGPNPITSTSTAANAWRVVQPVYAAATPYYFTCDQYKLKDGTYTWGPVQLVRSVQESNARIDTANGQIDLKADATNVYTKTETDGRITAEVSSAEARIQVTTDSISSEVSQKVGNSEVISKINQSPESVTINANRVNIEGAAIFTSGRLSQTSLNNAYDQNGAASAAQAAAISAAASDATSKANAAQSAAISAAASDATSKANAAQSAAISAAASDATSKANAAQTAATNAAKSYTDDAIDGISSEVGTLEAPYSEVEWVESHGTSGIYLDWKPSAATFGFEADFIINNAFSTTVGAWDTATNVNGYGNVFGVRNSSNVNDFQLGTYGTTGLLRYGGGKSYSTAGLLKTDKTRQTVKLIGTTLTRGDGTTVTITRGTDTANKPYSNMEVFSLYTGKRYATTGSLSQPGSVRIYSLKFYENTTLKLNLAPAVRKSDGAVGLYDKLAGKFYAGTSLTHGSVIGDLGEPPTLSQAMSASIPQLRIDNKSVTRLWETTCPSLSKLEDGQKFYVTFMYGVTASTQTTALADWDDTGNNSYVYLKLTLSDGSVTDWIPCYYMNGSRLTTHYGANSTILMTYRESLFVSATQASVGSGVVRGLWCDPNYADGNDTARYVQFYNTILAKEAIAAASIIGGDASGFLELQPGKKFDLSYPVLWTTAAINATKTNYSTLYTLCYDRTLATRYNSYTGTADAIVYLVGTIDGNEFTVDSTSMLAFAEPVTADGKFYIPIGKLGNQSNGKNYFNFSVTNPVTLYAYLDGKFRQVTPSEIVATHRVYYRTGTASSSLAAPATWVAEATGNVYNAWTTKVPPLAASTAAGQTKYPYLYTCEQRKRLDGTIECTKVLLDENTTVIDGGTIVTNSITANQIAAGTITVDELNATNINSSGALTVGAFSSTTQSTILNSAIEIGGRNLVRKVDRDNIATDAEKTYTRGGRLCSTNVIFEDRTLIAARTGNTSAPYTAENVTGATVSVSFDYKLDSSGTSRAIAVYPYQSTGLSTKANLPSFTPTSEWQHYEAVTNVYRWTTGNGSTTPGTFYTPETAGGSGTRTNGEIWLYDQAGTNKFVVKNVKIERGNKATDWSPAPEDQTAYADSGRIWYAECSTAAATVAKEATITPATTGFTLTAGVMVNVKFTNTNTGTVGSLTLNINGTGAKPLRNFYNGAVSNISSAGYLKGGSVITFRYDGTNWITDLTVNSTYSQDRRLHNNYILAAAAVASGKLACATSAGYKAIAAGVEFDLAYPILYASGAWAAGSQYANAYEAYPGVNPATTATVQGIAVNSMVFLKGTVSGGTFVVASTNFLTCTVPTSEDGYYYIPLGIVANDATTKMYFSTSDKLYAYYENSFQRVDVSATTRAIAAGKKADDVNSALGTLQTTVTSQIQNLGDSVQISVNSITSRLDSQDEILSDVTNTFDFTADGLIIGKSDSPVKSVLDNQALRFQAHAQDVMVLNGESSTAEMDRLKIGKYRWTSVDGGNAIALMYVG